MQFLILKGFLIRGNPDMSLRSVLEQIRDPRGKQGQDYRLWSILSLIVLSMVCGRRGMKAAFLLGRSLSRRQRAVLGFPRDRTPCHATLTETLRILDPQGKGRHRRRHVLSKVDCGEDRRARRRLRLAHQGQSENLAGECRNGFQRADFSPSRATIAASKRPMAASSAVASTCCPPRRPALRTNGRRLAKSAA